MSQGESSIVARIRRYLGRRADLRLFRNDCGTAWAGKVVHHQGRRVTLDGATRITYGLQPGSSDLIGWRSVEITPDMVGQRVAVFTSLEVKRRGKGATDKQKRWIAAVLAAGGIAGVVRSEQEAEQTLDGHEPE